MIFFLPLLLNVFVLMNRFSYRKFFISNTFVAQMIYYLNLFLMVSLHSDIYKNCLDGQLIWIVFLLYYLQSLFHMP